MRSCLRVGAAAVLLAQPGAAQDTPGAGGILDVDGLQNTLQSGGVEGLNKMLKAMAAAQGGGDSSAHLTKDASGNAMYDFRDINGPPKPETSPQTAAPPAPKVAPVVQHAAAQAPRAASSQLDEEPPMPDFGIVEPAKTRKPQLASHRSASAKLVAKAAVAPPDQDDDDDKEEMKAAPAEQQSHLIVWPPEASTVAAPQVKVVKAAPALAPPAVPVAQVQQATSTNDATVIALANGLTSMRQNLDTLLNEAHTMLHTHRQPGTPAPVAEPASASIGASGGAAGAEVLKRLQAIEDENAAMKKEQAAQASRLAAVEDKEQKVGAELNKAEDENLELHDEIKASQSASFLQDKKAPSGIRTFFHKKDKMRRH